MRKRTGLKERGQSIIWPASFLMNQGNTSKRATDRHEAPIFSLVFERREKPSPEFAIQLFDDNPVPNGLNTVEPHFLDYLEETTLEKKGYQRYLMSPKECQQIIQAFIWKAVIGEVFDNFAWVGAKASDDLFHLRRMWQPKKTSRRFFSKTATGSRS
ncbi:hypothetical protein B0T10DRAFT_569643 [Thelonectria olida]|uniref:Uncharacterized protein n=1 Tax=Thelonectria olida TaxID=1576542 RepID=A0A9P9AGZ5_9HYPO|nr:hypothetical protein B0T10DRAFT_569643 [Thelonectria olida]